MEDGECTLRRPSKNENPSQTFAAMLKVLRPFSALLSTIVFSVYLAFPPTTPFSLKREERYIAWEVQLPFLRGGSSGFQFSTSTIGRVIIPSRPSYGTSPAD